MPIPINRPRPNIAVQPPAGTWGFSFTDINGSIGSGDPANNPTVPGTTALRGFELRFTNGDHKIRLIRLAPDGEFSHVALSDQDSNDPFFANATYTTFEYGVPGEVTADGGGSFEIPLGTKPGGAHTLVLRGFELRRSDGTDANVRAVGITLDGDRNVARVTLTDDQGWDLSADVGNIVGGILLPLGGLIEAVQYGTGTAHPDTFQLPGDIPQTVGAYRGYRATVEYAWIPSALVVGTHALAGADRTQPVVIADIDALTGFEFMFTNSDHYLLGLGFNGNGGNRTPFFQDSDTGDPLKWTATYVTLDQGVLSPDQLKQVKELEQQAGFAGYPDQQ